MGCLNNIQEHLHPFLENITLNVQLYNIVQFHVVSGTRYNIQCRVRGLNMQTKFEWIQTTWNLTWHEMGNV